MKRLAATLCALLFSMSVGAQNFPKPGQPIRVLIGFAAGGTTDIQARVVAPRLAEALGVPVLVENKPGASTMIAAQEVARAAPDGHTILYTANGAFVQNAHTLANVPYDPFRDFTPLSLGARGPQLLLLHVSVPATNLKELVAWGKANPGKLNIASFGTGSSSHIFAEMLMRQTGLDMVHVPYKGAGDAAKDLIGGTVQLMFDPATSALKNAASGRLRILGVAADARSRFLPEVPTLAEQGYKGMDLTGWVAWYGPAGMQPATVQKLNAALVKVLGLPEVKEAFDRGAYEAASSTPEELGALTRDFHDRWGKIVRDLGMKPQ
jgi:tripartite-type tricarboxylate transporter receptor subunit TctC